MPTSARRHAAGAADLGEGLYDFAIPFPVPQAARSGRFVNRPYDKDTPLQRTHQCLPCVKGGGICEANDGGIVNNPPAWSIALRTIMHRMALGSTHPPLADEVRGAVSNAD